MKNEVQNGAYKNLLAQFKAHLLTVNYSKGTILSSSFAINEYLMHIENKQLKLIDTSTKSIQEYFAFLQTRTNKKTGLGLSFSYLLKIKSGLTLFYKFLNLTQQENYAKPVFPDIKKGSYKPIVLSKEEIEKLFKACDESLLGKRNKAILAIYYGCGLRRQEGTNLNVEDLDINKGLVFISKSKTRQQRNVPISSKMLLIVEDYLFNAREKLIDKSKVENALIVTERGNRLGTESVVYILQMLLKEAKITTKASPHTLRHSIATHLLESGMKLESIRLFLGHRSLDSTQIYTHLTK